MNSKSTTEIQNEIIEDFAFLNDPLVDRFERITHIQEIGKTLPKFDEKFKIEEFEIKGCQAKVWLYAILDGDRLLFFADSQSEVVKGVIALLIRVLSGQKLEDIINANLFFMEKVDLQSFLTFRRSTGIPEMIKKMKLYALGFKSKMEGAKT